MESANHALMSRLLADMKPELIIAHLSKCNLDWIREPFTPEYNKIYYIYEGVGRISVGGQELFPVQGQLVFAPAGLLQSFSVTDPGHTYRMYWCHFTSNLSFMKLFELFKLSYCLDAGNPEETVQCFVRLKELHRLYQGPAKSIRVQAALLDVIALYIEDAVRLLPQTASLSNNKLSDVLRFINEHLARDIKIAELAEVAHLHPNYFVRFFKSQLGVTPMSFIYEKRLDKAKQLIRASDKTISEIAIETGFHEVFHLSKSFKKSFGLSPTEYRGLYHSNGHPF
ncbi:AraC family transcriptional regulator [Paenibacillus filicis]|uniref:AraC family transcriptional regulator n=1 Tax=Paenibacillus gyeongsangnamensis TaxID=3388067 RepID=A0ABT4Q877_9BACL|nr:AraC family transcriptional regulator [Paenibacillus filicis]MCZ8513029.1 AraC family transcriptional regulator [Paenibacillus filicis]